MHRAVPSLLRVGVAACAVGAMAMFPASQRSHAASNQITLTWQTSDDTFWLTASKTVIKAYTALHPNVTVDLEPIPSANYDQKLFLEAAAGTLPDVVRTSDGETIPLAAHHILLDMQPFVNADPSFNVSDIYPTFLNLGRLPGQGGLYMMPFSADAVLVFYDKSMFDKAGLPYPSANWTYQDFLNDAQKLTLRDSSGKVTQWGLDASPTGWWATYAPWIEGFGGSVLTADKKHTAFDTPGSIAGMQAMADLVLKYKVAPGPNVVFPTDPFISGHAAMYLTVHGAVDGVSQAVGTKFKWDVQTMPSFPNGSHFTGEGTAGWAVSAGSRNRAAAWDIVKFVGSLQGQTALAKLGVTMPIRKSMLASPVWKVAGLNNQAFVGAINMGITPPTLLPLDSSVNCGTMYFGLMDTTITTMFQQILRGTPVATAAKTADTAINSCVDSLGN